MKFVKEFSKWFIDLIFRIMKSLLLPGYFTVICLFICKYTEMIDPHPVLWYLNMFIWSTVFFQELEERFKS